MSITSGTGEFATRAIHAGYDPADYGHAAVPPIYASAAFDLENAQRGDALAGGLIDGFEYSRVANPTVDVLEKRLAAIGGRYRCGGGRLRYGGRQLCADVRGRRRRQNHRSQQLVRSKRGCTR